MELTESHILYGNSEPRELSVHHDPVDGVARVSIVDDNVMLSFDLTRDQARQVIAELQKLTYVDFKIGDIVYWQDPDNTLCSGRYTISDITGTLEDPTIWLGDNQVFTHEITLIKSA